MRTVLVDTGPLVAYLDPGDPAHDGVSTSFGNISGAVCTTSAVITEAMHLLRSGPSGPRRLAEFVAATGVHILETTQPHHLLAAVALMEKYSDTPMDFADATLVLLSEETGADEIATLDRRGFATYRTRKGKRFRMLPFA